MCGTAKRGFYERVLVVADTPKATRKPLGQKKISKEFSKESLKRNNIEKAVFGMIESAAVPLPTTLWDSSHISNVMQASNKGRDINKDNCVLRAERSVRLN